MKLDELAKSISALSDHPLVQRVSLLLADWGLDKRTTLYVLLALAIGFWIGRNRRSPISSAASFQNRGEALLSRVILQNFAPPDYHLMSHVTLQMDDGTTQIDHILVSRFGVFVIEAKDYKGWIFANAAQAKWTQLLFYGKFRFQNPVFQNSRHVRAVKDLLDFLPHEFIKSAVVFTGDAEFKTGVPQGVFNLARFVDYVRDETAEVMTINRMQFCVGRLETARLAISGKTDVEHIQSLAQRHGGST
jgi:hypothetical protein